MAFVDNVRGDVLGSVGLAFLLYTVLSTIQKLEEAFNFAWHVERPRSIMRRVSEYLSLMVVGPIFLVVVFGLFGALGEPRLDGLARSQHEPFGTIVRALGVIGPFLFVTGVFTFLYSFVPNTRVRLKRGVDRRRWSRASCGRRAARCSRGSSPPPRRWSRSTRASRSSWRRSSGSTSAG